MAPVVAYIGLNFGGLLLSQQLSDDTTTGVVVVVVTCEEGDRTKCTTSLKTAIPEPELHLASTLQPVCYQGMTPAWLDLDIWPRQLKSESEDMCQLAKCGR